MIDWTETGTGKYSHPHRGEIKCLAADKWQWTDRRGRVRATFPTLQAARLAALKFSGTQLESDP